MTTYQSLDEIAVDYLSSMQDADESLFAAGDKLVTAHDQGYGLNAIWKAAASHRKVSRATVNNHMRTALIFPPDTRAEDVTWNIFYTCARQANMRKPETWATAHEWLDKVVELGWGKAQLDEAIKAAKGNPKAGEPVYLLRNVEATIVSVSGWASVTFTLNVNPDYDPKVNEMLIALEKSYGQCVQITILQPATEVQQLDAEAKKA